MIYHVSFPGLGLELTVNRVAFTLFGINIYWYGVLIALGLMLGLAYAFAHARSYGINSDRMVDVILVATVCAIIGGRAFYVLTAPFEYESLWQMLDIRLGGVAIYGAVIGAFLSGAVMCRVRRVRVLPMFDVAAVGFLIGQAVGRWGNFVNQEAFGTNTTLPWGMISEGTTAYLQSVQATLAAQGIVVDPNLPVHPTFLYESLWCFLGFVLLWAYQRRRKFDGEILLLYLVWYGAERFVVEGLRTDSLMVGPFRISQLIAAACVVVAGGLWLYLRRRNKGRPLAVVWPVLDKRLNGPASITWTLGEATPSEEELKRRTEELVAAQTGSREEAAGPAAAGAKAPEAAAAPACGTDEQAAGTKEDSGGRQLPQGRAGAESGRESEQ